MSEENTFTQEQVQEMIAQEKEKWESEVLNPLQNELDEVKAQLPKEPTEQEKEMQQKQQELWQKEVNLTLKENGLGKFADVVSVQDKEQLQETVKTLSNIVSEMKVDLGYVPESHKSQNEYDSAKSKGDTKGMVKALLGMSSK